MKRNMYNKLLGMIVCGFMVAGCSACSSTDKAVENPVPETEITKQEETKQEETTQVETKQEETTQAETTESEPTVTEQAEEKEPAADTTAQIMNQIPNVSIKGTEVNIGVDFNTLLGNIGEPDDLNTARSCTGEGDEKVYQYGGINVYTHPSSGQDIVYILELTGTEKLPSGIGIGSAKDDVISVYGAEYTDEGDYISYEYDNETILGFQLDSNGNVTFIEIYG